MICTEAPEEEYDPRSLYERLQEQKDKKQRDFEESIKFSMFFMLWGSIIGGRSIHQKTCKLQNLASEMI